MRQKAGYLVMGVASVIDLAAHALEAIAIDIGGWRRPGGSSCPEDGQRLSTPDPRPRARV